MIIEYVGPADRSVGPGVNYGCAHPECDGNVGD
jgi:hypothetical protein